MKFSFVTYNLGGGEPSRANDIIISFFDKKELPDVCVFGFQEMKGHFNLNHYFHSAYQLPLIHSACQGVSKSFNLCLIIYVKNNIQFHKVEDNKICTRLGYHNWKYYGSKGIQNIILNIEGKIYLFMNLHAPFASAKAKSGGTYAEFYQDFIQKTITKFKSTYFSNNSGCFVLGDLNSRSYLNFDNVCKQETSCLLMKGFNTKNATQQDFGADFPKQSVQQILNKKQFYQQQQIEYGTLVEKLKRSDALTTFLGDKDLKDIKEIHFLPSYKRNTKTAQFQLSKDDKLRLPGYADRILTNLDSINIKYNAYRYDILKDQSDRNITGSDHVPVYGIIEIFH
jgi:hypothetical protein